MTRRRVRNAVIPGLESDRNPRVDPQASLDLRALINGEIARLIRLRRHLADDRDLVRRSRRNRSRKDIALCRRLRTRGLPQPNHGRRQYQNERDEESAHRYQNSLWKRNSAPLRD